jgi:hypothetical protein
MIPGNPRTAGDRPRVSLARRVTPEPSLGRGIAIAILLSILLWALLILAGIHVYARIFA